MFGGRVPREHLEGLRGNVLHYVTDALMPLTHRDKADASGVSATDTVTATFCSALTGLVSTNTSGRAR